MTTEAPNPVLALEGKLIISSTVLSQSLGKLLPFVQNDAVLPILENILATVKNGSMTLLASDLTTSASATIPVESTSEGMAILPVGTLTKLLATLREQPLTLAFSLNSVTLISTEGEYEFRGLDQPKDFPKLPGITPLSSFCLPVYQLRGLLRSLRAYMASDDLRPAMTGVYWTTGNDEGQPMRHELVACDGHRLLRLTPDIAKLPASPFTAILPATIIHRLASGLPKKGSEVTIEIGDTNARIAYGHFTFVTRLVNERYPDYANAIPTGWATQLVLDRQAFISAVKRASIFASQTIKGMHLEVRGTSVSLHVENLDYAQYMKEKVPVAEREGEDIKLGFNARNMLASLRSMTCPTIALHLVAPNRATLAYPYSEGKPDAAETHLIMPIMLNQRPY